MAQNWCATCYGTGKKPGGIFSFRVLCPDCMGTGTVPTPTQEKPPASPAPPPVVLCPHCGKPIRGDL